MQRAIGPLGIELPYCLGERVAEQHGGVRNRTAGGECEKPELEAIEHGGVVEEVVEHVGPSADARGRAVDEHDRDTAGPERLRKDEFGGELLAPEIAEEECPAFQAPLRSLAQRPGQGGGRLD